jgi:protein-S-isoprenylcysteine O-methyltransferase Ste14
MKISWKAGSILFGIVLVAVAAAMIVSSRIEEKRLLDQLQE